MNTPEERNRLYPRMLVVITRVEDREKLEKLFGEAQIPILHQCRGKGTAPSEMMDIFGLSGTARLITVAFLPKQKAGELLEGMEQRLAFRQRGGGIALTIPVTGLQTHILNLLKDEVHSEVEKRMEERTREDMEQTENSMEYVVIWASISTGYSEDVVDAARSAGARGGTILKGRRRSSDRVSQYLGVSKQEEQEFVMIVAPKTKKREIMAAISRSCGLGTDAHGVVLSLPVDEAIGLEA